MSGRAPTGLRLRDRRLSLGGDAGNGTLFVLWVATLVWVVGIVLAVSAEAIVVRHRASAAADLAALAAADRALYGEAAACAAAQRVTDDMRAVLSACVLDGQTADVSTTVRPESHLFVTNGVTVRARAGPARPASVGWESQEWPSR